jgi:hypothetical protein
VLSSIEIVDQTVTVKHNKMKAVPKGNKGGGSVKKMKRGGVAKKKK